MLKPARDLYGYKKLLVYQKADEFQRECSLLTSHFPKYSNFSNSPSTPSVPLKTLYSLSDQMNRSARSVKQNIVEGWKRNSTKEYYEFLGFSIGACAELEEDCDDIWKGKYQDLMGEKGVMGELPHSVPFDIDKLKFYPLDLSLPPVVQLKLRCKEILFLLDKLQKSLVMKMGNEGTMATADKLKLKREQGEREGKWEEKMLEDLGLVKLENGMLVKREKREERE